MGELTDKTAIVTGGASGIGRATVEAFVREGAKVVIADLNGAAAKALAEELPAGTAVAVETDVADAGQVRDLVDLAVHTYGDLDVLVNNAGVSGPMFASFLDDDLEAFDRIVGVNLRGVMVGTQAAAQHMAEHGGGSIINTSSIGGIQAGRGMMTYRATKAAVIQFTKGAAIELGPLGIRVNCLAPGSIPTPLLAGAGKDMSEEEREALIRKVRDAQAQRRPLNVQGTPEHPAEAAVFLAGERSCYITGVVLRVDGGTAAGSSINALK